MSSFDGSDHAQTEPDAQERALRAEIQPGELSQALADALGQADEAMRHARDALGAARMVEQRMRIMDDRLQAMAAASSSINWLTTGEGQMEDAPHWRRFTGQSAEQARGWGWLDAIHPEDHPRVIAGWQEALHQRLPYTDEYRVRRADGVYRDFLTQAAPIYEDDGTVREWVGVCIDISARKHLERGVADNIAQLEAIFEAMGDAIFVYDEYGQPIRSNQASRDIYGVDLSDSYLSLPREERRKLIPAFDMEGRPLEMERRPAARALRGEVFRGDQAQDVRMRAADGRLHDLNFTGAPIWRDNRIVGAVVVARDVTVRRRLERVAHEAERQAAARASELEAALEAMTDGVALYAAEGRLVRMNRAAGIFLALPTASADAPEAQAAPMRADVALIRRLLEGADDGDAASAPHDEMRFVGLDGHERDLSLTGAAIRDVEGRVTGAVIVARNVTVRNRLERQRRDMLQMVGHDLASPLQAARVYVQRRRRLPDAQAGRDERDAQALAAMEHSLERIERLVGDLQLAARIELGTLRLTPARVDLCALERAEADLTAAATGREIHLEAPDEPVLADVDASRIGQALANLLGNAHKYSPSDCPIWLMLAVEQEQARVSVRDEGPGIPTAEIEHIWEQFHQVEGITPLSGSAGGLGLGLYIARSIVEAHGGVIGVESVIGRGSTFWFTLPLVASEGQ
jgi:PAS domain S-box-containing protein